MEVIYDRRNNSSFHKTWHCYTETRAKADLRVKGWGERRGEPALIYSIPNHQNPNATHHKGITQSEFEKAYQVLQRTGEFSRIWFNQYLPACAKEGGCNFTTIGGIFQLLSLAEY